MIFKKRETISEIVLLRSSNQVGYYLDIGDNESFNYLIISGDICYGVWVAKVIFCGYLFFDMITFTEDDFKREFI